MIYWLVSTFQLDNLIDSVQKLKDLAKELLLKEAFLEDIEEPVITNIDNLIGKYIIFTFYFLFCRFYSN